MVLLTLVAFAWAQTENSVSDEDGERDGNGGQGGGPGGAGQFGSCIIAPAGTTNCTGVTGPSCSDSANLKVNIG